MVNEELVQTDWWAWQRCIVDLCLLACWMLVHVWGHSKVIGDSDQAVGVHVWYLLAIKLDSRDIILSSEIEGSLPCVQIVLVIGLIVQRMIYFMRCAELLDPLTGLFLLEFVNDSVPVSDLYVVVRSRRKAGNIWIDTASMMATRALENPP